MRALRLRDLVVRLGFARVNHIWELESVLDEEDRNIVSNDVPVTPAYKG